MLNIINYADEIQKRHGRELGFLPLAAYHEALKRECLQPILSPSGNRVGFLLHGPPRPGAYTRVYQICVEPDHRRQLHGTHKIEWLKDIAEKHNSDWVTLRCATDLPAVLFWQAVGGIIIAERPGSPRTGRYLAEIAIPCTPAALAGTIPPPPPPRRLNPNIPNKLAEWLSYESGTIYLKNTTSPKKLPLALGAQPKR